MHGSITLGSKNRIPVSASERDYHSGHLQQQSGQPHQATKSGWQLLLN